MAGVSFSMRPVHTSDAEFRAWGDAFSTALQSAGLVQTADTGQIDWTTVARPGVTNTVGGYEIFYLNDSMHATEPVYAKVEYGSGSSTSSACLWWSFGDGSDGAGNLTNVWGTRVQYSNPATAWATAQTCYASAWDGGFAIWGGMDTSLSVFCFSYERSVDPSTGAPTADGAVLNRIWSASSAPAGAYYRYRSSTNAYDTLPGHYFPVPGMIAAEASQAVGSDVYLYPGSFWLPAEGVHYCNGSMAVGGNDFSAGATFTADTYGGSYAFMAATGTSRSLRIAAATGLCLAYRYE